jgi:hypothetical protein
VIADISSMTESRLWRRASSIAASGARGDRAKCTDMCDAVDWERRRVLIGAGTRLRGAAVAATDGGGGGGTSFSSVFQPSAYDTELPALSLTAVEDLCGTTGGASSDSSLPESLSLQ